ncbi:50S ribosomal protein L28 [Candidatus Falkowbacteria bacterium]|nr:50S ribosomal protein L28 [Candidatus Falkowbacteria bacterium]
MSKSCSICGRKPLAAQNRSHSNVATKRRQFLNLQTKTIDGKKIKICAKCIKTMSKKKK